MANLDSNRHDTFLRLFSAHESAVRRFVRSLVPTRDDASEIMQEVAIVLWRKFGELREPEHFRRWAFGVARYEVMAWRRDKARDRHVFGEDLSGILADESESLDSDQDERLYALEHCLKKLPSDRQRLLRRAYDGETRIDSLALEMNRTAMSLYKVLHRLRLKMVECTQEVMRRGEALT